MAKQKQTMTKQQKNNAGGETPLMTQYNAIKAQHRDAILFFRMGDFYEMFGEDAKVGARVLGITLTSRGHGKTGDIPLAGFPHHAVEGYLAKMVRAGHRVAICDQVEDPKLAKGIVKRDVIQVVTPGTVTGENLLESRRNNYLSAICRQDDMYGLSSADVSTGEFSVTECTEDKVREEIEAIGPAELIVPEGESESIKALFGKNGRLPMLTKREDWLFGRDFGYDTLVRHFKTNSLKGFGCENLGAGIGAAGAVIQYLMDTQKTSLDHVRRLVPYSDAEFMVLDSATRRNLEITTSMISGDREGTLLAIIDRTQTAMGGRTLTSWIQRPLKQQEPIDLRLQSVESFFENGDLRTAMSETLKGMGDLERLISKVVTRRANPRDLKALERTLEKIPKIRELLISCSSDRLLAIRNTLDDCREVVERIQHSLTDDPPAAMSDGRIIREGYNDELDVLRELAFSGKDWIAQLQKSERERTDIPSLKVGFNKVFGYYIEVTKTHLEKIPEDYIRKQTLVNAERFITPELKEQEEKILNAEEKMVTLEHRLFDELRLFAAGFAEPVQNNGRLIGELDATVSLARIAQENRYVKPEINSGDTIKIRDGRHPVIEQLLPPGDPFIPNDIDLNNADQQLLIITGPNMAGKSTYIRQLGLIVLLAQIGSYVPATSARIGIVDRIFTRVGAQDNLAGGESTFLVEMNETANILNNATSNSLILLDEIGRGTSTFDGLSIAWAVAEYIHNAENVQAKTLFATHYHELTELALILPRVKNYNVAVKEWGDHVVFLRKIVPGGCDHSYGIQVARLAGLPDSVLRRAREILHNLEANELTPNEMPRLAMGEHAPEMVPESQMSLFVQQENKLREALEKLDINNMTPLEALQILNEFKALLKE